MEPLIGVIVVCYGHAHYLSECIDSVLLQSYQNLEIVVVDDGSPDDVFDVVKRSGSDKVNYFEIESHVGLAEARNAGIEFSMGEWFLPLNAADKLPKGALEAYVETLKKPGVDIVYGDVQMFGADRSFITYRQFELAQFVKRPGMPYSILFSSGLWQAVKYENKVGYNMGADPHEDTMFWIDCLLLGAKPVHCEETSLYQRVMVGERTPNVENCLVTQGLTKLKDMV